MLVLTRRAGQSLQIGENITITVYEVRGQSVKLSIDAPKEIKILRTELKHHSKKESSENNG